MSFEGIFVTGTYMVITWYIKVAFLVMLLICALVLGLYVEYGGHAVADIFVHGHMLII